MNQTLSLYRLQQIDSQIDRVQSRIEKIQNELENDEELRQTEALVNNAEEHYKSTQLSLKKCEQIVERQQIKIEQTQSDLYGKKQHSPKELQDLENDVAALKRHLTTLEDAQIEAMIACEEAEKKLETARAKLKTVRANRSVSDKDLIKEQDSLGNDLDRCRVERNAVAIAIPSTELEMYDHLRETHRGVAVAAISDGACSACGSSLNRALIQSVRSSGQSSSCPSCGRILYGN